MLLEFKNDFRIILAYPNKVQNKGLVDTILLSYQMSENLLNGDIESINLDTQFKKNEIGGVGVPSGTDTL